MNLNKGQDAGLPLFTFLSGEKRDSFWLRSANNRGARASTSWVRNHRDRFSDVFDLGARYRVTRRHNVAADHECMRIVVAK